MVEKCEEETKPKTLNVKCGVETGELVIDKFTRGGSSRCILHPNVSDFLLNPIEFVALAGKSQPWKQGIKSQDKHIQKFIDSKVLKSCPKSCDCTACEYTRSNPTDFNKVYLMVYGKESPQKTMNKESQPSSNGTENNNIEEDILIDEFCNDASPFKPKESSDQGEEKVVTSNGVEALQNGVTVQPTRNGAKVADSKVSANQAVESKMATNQSAESKMATNQSAESKMATSQPTPTKDEEKRVKQGTPDGRKQKDIRSFFNKTPSERKNDEQEKIDEKQTVKDIEIEKPKSALRIKFEGGELARINSKDDIDLVSAADSGKDDINVVSAESVKDKNFKNTNVKEMAASLLPEVRDEFERSFEQKEASKEVVSTNGGAKEQVRRSKRALDIEIIKEVSKSAKTEPKSTQSSEGKGLKRKRNSSPEVQEIKVKSIKTEPNSKPVKRISPNIANVGTRSWNSKTKSKSQPVSPKKPSEKPREKPTETPVIQIQGRPKRTIVSPAKLQDPLVITLDSPKKTPIKIKTEPVVSQIRLSPRKYECLLTTPEKLKSAGEKCTPGRIKKEEFVVYKRSSSLTITSKAPTPTKNKAVDSKETGKGATNTVKTNQQSKQSKQADAKNTQKVSAVVTGNKGKQGVVVKQEPGDGGRDGGDEGKDKTSPSKLPPYASMIKHALSELNTVGGPGCTKLEILLFILRRYKPKDNITHVTNKLLDALDQNIKKGMLLSSASCTPRKRKDLTLKSPIKEKEKSNPKKSPTADKKKVLSVKGKGNKEAGPETGAKTKKKVAVKTNEKIRIIGVKPKKLQEPLAAICKAKKLSRVDALKRVWGYIHSNKLLDPQDKSRIICDDKMKKLTKCKAIVSKTLLGHVKNAMLAQ